MVDTCSSFLGNAVAVLEHLGVLVVDKSGQITTIIKDEVERFVILESN